MILWKLNGMLRLTLNGKVKPLPIGIGLFKRVEGSKWAWSTMGEWDLTLWVDADGPDALEKFVSKKLKDCNLG